MISFLVFCTFTQISQTMVELHPITYVTVYHFQLELEEKNVSQEIPKSQLLRYTFP